MAELERDIKLRIKKLLDKLGIDNWRMQAGGYRGRTRGLPKGTPDILAAPSVRNVPLFLWIETKTSSGIPSDEQLKFADEKRSKGHYWIIARCEDDVLSFLKDLSA